MQTLAFAELLDFADDLGSCDAKPQGANFTGALLVGARFTGANLSRDPSTGVATNFANAFLQGAKARAAEAEA